jgi:hypothetical protein
MSRPSLLQVTVVLLLALAGLMAVSAAYRASDRRDSASKPETRPATPPVDPSLVVPKLAPGPPDALAAQPPPPATAARRPGPSFSVARVRGGRRVALRSKPDGRRLVTVGSKTEYGSSNTMAVAARRRGWLGLTSSDLPNRRLGWVRAGNRSLDVYSTSVSVRIDISRRSLVLRNGRHVVRRARVAVGRAGSHTPTGRFSITDALRGSAFGPYYGCCILALSGHQPHPPAGWTGGTRLAIHGTNNPRSIGFPASAGCLRASRRSMQALMRHVPLGTTVFIHA